MTRVNEIKSIIVAIVFLFGGRINVTTILTMMILDSLRT